MTDKRQDPRAEDEAPVVQPPSTLTVDYERKPILHLPDGRVLVRRPAGFRT